MHSAQTAPAATYLAALDGLRAVSIGLVIASHLGLGRVLPGAFGVTLFFFISGYLITRQLAASLERGRRIDFGGFYLRRALRLVPAATAYILLAGGLYVAAGGHISAGGWAAAWLYGANYYDLWTGYRSSLAGVRHPFNILWSLAIEEHFYLIWPLALAALWRRGWAVPGLAALCLAVLLWRASLLGLCFHPLAPWVCGPENPNPLWRYNRLYLATDTRLDSIAWGALLALLPVGRGGAGAAPGTAPSAARWHPSAGWYVGLVLLAASFGLPGAWGRFVLRPSVQGFGMLLALPALLDARSPLARALSQRGAVLIGRLSYSLYLWHWGALALADAAAPAGGAAWLAVAAPLAAALAACSYWGIERPMLRLRRRFGSHAPLALPAAPQTAPAPLAPRGTAGAVCADTQQESAP